MEDTTKKEKTPPPAGERRIKSLQALDALDGTSLVRDYVLHRIDRDSETAAAISLDTSVQFARSIAKSLGIDLPKPARAPRAPRGPESVPSCAVTLDSGASAQVSGFGVRHAWIFQGDTPPSLTDAEIEARRLPVGCRRADALRRACNVDAIALYVRADKNRDWWARVATVDGVTAPQPPAPPTPPQPEPDLTKKQEKPKKKN
jgi:hypothetical protein